MKIGKNTLVRTNELQRMESRTMKRYFAAAILLVVLTVSLTPAVAQEAQVVISDGRIMESHVNKTLALRWVEEFMLTGNPATAAELVSADFVAYDLAGSALDIISISDSVASLNIGSVNLNIQVQTVIAEKDLVAVHWIAQGTAVAIDHGSAFDAWTRNGTSFIRIADGQIAEVRQSFNTISSPGLSWYNRTAFGH